MSGMSPFADILGCYCTSLDDQVGECQGCHLLLISLAAIACFGLFNFYELAFDGCRVASINHCQDVKELS